MVYSENPSLELGADREQKLGKRTVNNFISKRMDKKDACAKHMEEVTQSHNTAMSFNGKTVELSTMRVIHLSIAVQLLQSGN